MSRKQRNRCQYCRLLKCLQMGMNRKGKETRALGAACAGASHMAQLAFLGHNLLFHRPLNNQN